MIMLPLELEQEIFNEQIKEFLNSHEFYKLYNISVYYSEGDISFFPDVYTNSYPLLNTFPKYYIERIKEILIYYTTEIVRRGKKHYLKNILNNVYKKNKINLLTKKPNDNNYKSVNSLKNIIISDIYMRYKINSCKINMRKYKKDIANKVFEFYTKKYCSV